MHGDDYSTVIEQAMVRVDWDKSGSLDFQEFCQFINEVLSYIDELREETVAKKVY